MELQPAVMLRHETSTLHLSCSCLARARSLGEGPLRAHGRGDRQSRGTPAKTPKSTSLSQESYLRQEHCFPHFGGALPPGHYRWQAMHARGGHCPHCHLSAGMPAPSAPWHRLSAGNPLLPGQRSTAPAQEGLQGGKAGFRSEALTARSSQSVLTRCNEGC